MNDNAQCLWCGSTNTHFLYYQCWEEDERGNTIHVSTLETEFTPRDEVWRCKICDGDSAYAIETSEGES